MSSQTHQLKEEINSFINQHEGVLKRKGERLLKKLNKKLERFEKERDPIFKKRSLARKKAWETRRRKLPQPAYITRSAHNGRARDYVIKNYIPITPDKFFERSQNEVTKALKDHLPNKTAFKLQCVFENVNRTPRREVEQYISTNAMTILSENSINNIYQRAVEEILQKIIDFTNEESGWVLKAIIALHLSVSDYNPIRGSSYRELSKHYKDKKCIVNVKNKKDNKCCKWAITISLNMPKKDRERVTKKTREDSKKYNWDDMVFPSTVKDLEIFEKNNPNIALIVFVAFGSGKKEIAPLYLSDETKLDTIPKENISTLLVYDGHFTVVTTENALLLKEGQEQKVLVCRRCISTFATCGKSTAQEKLDKHSKLCRNFDYAKTKFPKEGKHILKFKNYRATFKHPIKISFDFESLLEKCDPGEMENTKQISKHTPFSFGLYVNRFDNKNEYFDHIGLDAVKIFVDKLESIVKEFYKFQ